MHCRLIEVAGIRAERKKVAAAPDQTEPNQTRQGIRKRGKNCSDRLLLIDPKTEHTLVRHINGYVVLPNYLKWRLRHYYSAIQGKNLIMLRVVPIAVASEVHKKEIAIAKSGISYKHLSLML